MLMAATVNQVSAPAIAHAALRRISWGAVFAGAIVALAVELMLGVLGVGVGASAIKVGAGTSPMSGLGLGAAIWFVISALIAIYIGGWVAGKLAGVPTRTDGALHGFITWALATLALFYLLSTAVGALMGGAASFLESAAGIAAKGANITAPAMTNAFSTATGTAPQDVRNQAGDVAKDPRFQTVVADVMRNGQVSPQDHQALVGLVAQHQGIPQAQAETEVSHWEQELQQARSKATRAANRAAGDTARASIWTFIMLILALIVGCGGGAVGAPENSMLIPLGTHPLHR
jgi:hypothetical protein